MDIMSCPWIYWPRQLYPTPVFFYVLPPISCELKLEPQTVQSNGPTAPQQALTNIQNFLLRTEHLPSGTPRLGYMKLKRRLRGVKLPNLAQFKYLHKGNVQRYKSTYMGKKVKRSWSGYDELILLWIVHRFHLLLNTMPQQFKDSTWDDIAKMIPFRQGEECMFRWLSMIQSHLAENPWTSSQKDQLLKLIAEQNQNIDWKRVSIQLFKQNRQIFRSPKQCRQHYQLFLNPSVNHGRTVWSFQEDKRMLGLYVDYQKKWKQISRIMVSRTENAVKNRFNLIRSHYQPGSCIKRNKAPNLKFLMESIQKEERLHEEETSRRLRQIRSSDQSTYKKNDRSQPQP